jgi:hypothetical protein
MASEDGSGTGSNASKPGCAKFLVDVNMSVLLSVDPSAVKVAAVVGVDKHVGAALQFGIDPAPAIGGKRGWLRSNFVAC